MGFRVINSYVPLACRNCKNKKICLFLKKLDWFIDVYVNINVVILLYTDVKFTL